MKQMYMDMVHVETIKMKIHKAYYHVMYSSTQAAALSNIRDDVSVEW